MLSTFDPTIQSSIPNSSHSPLFFFLRESRRGFCPRRPTMEFGGDDIGRMPWPEMRKEEEIERLGEPGAVSERLTIKLNPIQVVFPFDSSRSPSHDNSNLTQATCLPAFDQPRRSISLFSRPVPPHSSLLRKRNNDDNNNNNNVGRGRTDFSSFQSDTTPSSCTAEGWVEGEKRQGFCRALSVSANSSALSRIQCMF